MLEINEYQAAVVRAFLTENWCDFINCCCDYCDYDKLAEDGTSLAKDITAALGDTSR